MFIAAIKVPFAMVRPLRVMGCPLGDMVADAAGCLHGNWVHGRARVRVWHLYITVTEALAPPLMPCAPVFRVARRVRPGEREDFGNGIDSGQRGAGAGGLACGTTWSQPAGQSLTYG